MINLFKITKRHYDIMVKQALDNLPQESGGFLGGKEGFIQAILPIFNQHLYNRTDTFSFTPEDVQRAHAFFEKHGLSYIGMYHSHPKGAPVPSEPDINSRQPCHFIIGCRDTKNPVMRAYLIQGKTVIPVPIEIVDGPNIEVVDPKAKKETKPPVVIDEAEELNAKLNMMVQEKKVQYPKLDPKDKTSSDFSTLA